MIKHFIERPSTSPYIQTVWQAELSGPGNHILPAKGGWDFMFVRKKYGAKTFLIAPTGRAQTKIYDEDGAIYVGIRLKTGVQVAGLYAHEMLEKMMDLQTNTQRFRWVDGSSLQVPDFENAEQFVKKLEHRNLITHNPVVTAHIEGKDLDVSTRTVQRHYLQATGLSPQYIAMIDRAFEAHKLLQKGDKAVTVAYEAGYVDQAHLTHSVKRILGTLPSKINTPA